MSTVATGSHKETQTHILWCLLALLASFVLAVLIFDQLREHRTFKRWLSCEDELGRLFERFGADIIVAGKTSPAARFIASHPNPFVLSHALPAHLKTCNKIYVRTAAVFSIIGGGVILLTWLSLSPWCAIISLAVMASGALWSIDGGRSAMRGALKNIGAAACIMQQWYSAFPDDCRSSAEPSPVFGPLFRQLQHAQLLATRPVPSLPSAQGGEGDSA